MKIATYLLLFSILFTSCEETKDTTSNIQSKITKELTAYIGTYTRTEGHVDGKAEGIYQLKIDSSVGKITDQKTVAELINPSFLKLSKDQSHLYVVSELANEDEPTGFLYNYKITEDSLQFLERLPTDGQAPCHIEVDQTGEYIFVANYVGGKVKIYKRNKDASLVAVQSLQFEGSSVHPQQKSPHLHSTKVSPDNKIVAFADKGTDKVWLFEWNSSKDSLIAHNQGFVQLEAGAGPRHLDWSKDGEFLYVINELDNTINVIQYDSTTKNFTSIQSISTLPIGYESTSYCADIHIHPNGKFLYGSNRGHNSIAMYEVAPTTGKLSLLGFESTRGEFPRNFNISPNGKLLFVANQNTGNITAYSIDAATGMLQFLDLDYNIATPVCIEY